MISALVLGANGQLGKALISSFIQNNIKCVGLTRSDLDLKNLIEIEQVLGKYDIDLIVNCVAITDVNWAEANENDTFLINTFAVEKIGNFANISGKRLIQISTDYVFEGNDMRFNAEGDPTNPLSTYGKSKLRAEESLQEIMANNLVIVRTGGLYGGHQSNLVNFVLREISAGREVRLPVDQFYQPTHVHDLANVISGIAHDPHINGVFHSASSGSVSKFEFARRISIENNLDPRLILGVPFKSMPNSQIRPKYSLLNSDKLQMSGHPSIGSWDKNFQS